MKSNPLIRWRCPRALTLLFSLALPAACLALGSRTALGADAAPASESIPDFHKQIEPLLTHYCYDCHGNGEKNGQVAFDAFKSDDEMLHSPELWYKALRNVRSGIMPPPDNPRPTQDEIALLARWIKYKGLGIDPADPDPGRATLRRLNRTEYRNSIRDLTGFDFKTDEEFPSDDTGYGFDNIGDVLNVSPLLLEKYLAAAETIIAGSVPTESKTIAETVLRGAGEGRRGRGGGGAPLSFYKEAKAPFTFKAEQSGSYRVVLDLVVRGQFDFDPGRAHVTFTDDDHERLSEEYGWNEGKKFHYEFDEKWDPGEHSLVLELKPLTAVEKRINNVDLEIALVKVVGPTESEYRVPAKGYSRFFTREEPPSDAGERRAYAKELLSRFAKKAFRRPPDDEILGRLVGLAEATYSLPDKKFEEGIQRALIAILSSPRFLFRIEGPDPAHEGASHPPVDEYALASRLSYFLWSSMPDDELFRLADRGELRTNLAAQVKRMLKDSRSEALVENFVGQWLQVRDVEGASVNERAIAAREDDELRKLLEAAQNAKDDMERRAAFRALRSRRQNNVELTADLRRAMQDEVNMLFGHILRENHSLLELIDCDYAFLNEKLAQHYGIKDVAGPQMRKVSLPEDSPRGGVLTSAAVLIVTSNPDRTSPVKRGLFILDNIVGSPPPPPPGNVPLLEESEKAVTDHPPTMKELLELHRAKPLCSSCHSRMDPLGLGFENFNALGMWREKERGQPIESKGELITGDSFDSVRDLKHLLLGRFRQDIYRCITEKMLTYALGRGLTYNDVDSVDQIIERLERDDGKMSALVMGVIESAEFQRIRTQ
jgi:Protein of unknown function (DUF1592)/Protein of unknown function (DUF1588)/Protein of unknown function (DUF1587)/Protein of unknown function (DUF1585)/Protein of unknown function (DUF1595)/Planctomycete cytochrome C